MQYKQKKKKKLFQTKETNKQTNTNIQTKHNIHTNTHTISKDKNQDIYGFHLPTETRMEYLIYMDNYAKSYGARKARWDKLQGKEFEIPKQKEMIRK